MWWLYMQCEYTNVLCYTVSPWISAHRKTTLLQHCYQIEGIKRNSEKSGSEQVLPEYSCLLLSPANLWQQSLQSFSLDANIVNTVYKHQVTSLTPAAVQSHAAVARQSDVGELAVLARRHHRHRGSHRVSLAFHSQYSCWLLLPANLW